MNSKKANLAFLITIIGYVALIYAIALFAPALADNIFTSNLLVEAVVVLPIMCFMLASGEKPVYFMGFHRMKISSVFMVVLFTLLSSPLITLLNLFSQLWVENAAVAAMENMNIGQLPFWQVFLSLAILGPFLEEAACRGMFYQSYQKSGSKLGAMLLSSLIFALIHMNLNQAVYAFGMGVLAVLLVEATGSLWSSILYHGLINGSQSIFLYSALKINPTLYSEQAELITKDTLIYGLAVYLILTAITLPLAWAVLMWIGGNEGRRENLSAVFKKRTGNSLTQENTDEVQNRKIKKDKLVTVPLVLGLILCVSMITGILPLIINYIILLIRF